VLLLQSLVSVLALCRGSEQLCSQVLVLVLQDSHLAPDHVEAAGDEVGDATDLLAEEFDLAAKLRKQGSASNLCGGRLAGGGLLGLLGSGLLGSGSLDGRLVKRCQLEYSYASR
jgi:hypothetical protein